MQASLAEHAYESRARMALWYIEVWVNTLRLHEYIIIDKNGQDSNRQSRKRRMWKAKTD